MSANPRRMDIDLLFDHVAEHCRETLSRALQTLGLLKHRDERVKTTGVALLSPMIELFTNNSGQLLPAKQEWEMLTARERRRREQRMRAQLLTWLDQSNKLRDVLREFKLSN